MQQDSAVRGTLVATVWVFLWSGIAPAQERVPVCAAPAGTSGAQLAPLRSGQRPSEHAELEHGRVGLGVELANLRVPDFAPGDAAR